MEVIVLTGCFIFISLVGYLFAGSVDKFLNHVLKTERTMNNHHSLCCILYYHIYLPNFHQLFS